MTKKTGWYTPPWNAFKIVDRDGKDIPVDAVELHTDNVHIYAHYKDNAGKKWQNITHDDVLCVVLAKPFRVIPKPGHEKLEGRHIALSNQPQEYEEGSRMRLNFHEETIKTGWESLDFTPEWWKRVKVWFSHGGQR